MYLASIAVILLSTGIWRETTADQDASNGTSPNSTDVCEDIGQQSEEPAQTMGPALGLVQSLNQSADPCDDFYTYACGGWIEKHPIPAGEKYFFRFGLINTAFSEIKQKIFQSNSTILPELQSEAKVKALYAQCTDERKMEEAGISPLLQLLNRTLGGWPVLSPNWLNTSGLTFGLSQTLQQAFLGQQQLFFSVSVVNDLNDPSQYVLMLDEPTSLLGSDILHSEQAEATTESYIQLVTDITALLLRDTNDPRNVSDFQRDVMNLVQFGRSIATAGRTAMEKQDLSTRKTVTTLDALQQSYPFNSTIVRNLTSYIGSLFDSRRLAITGSTPVINLSPGYLQHVDARIAELERLGPVGQRRLASLAGWAIIQSNIDYLPKRYREAMENHQSRVAGKKPVVQPTAVRCAKFVTDIMTMAVNALFVKYEGQQRRKLEATQVFETLRSAVRSLLDDALWMNNDTRALAYKKLDMLIPIVAYPDAVVNNLTAVDSLYRDLVIGGTFFNTVQAIARNNRLRNLDLLGTIMPRGDEFSESFDVTYFNAFNDVGINMLVAPIAVFQSPFFSSDCPPSFNYGGVGFTIGHELTHTFDPNGALFNEVGAMKSWWDNATWAEFNRRNQGLMDQYNRYSLPQGSVNGEQTNGENVADNGGVKAAFRAFRKAQAKASNARTALPGVQNFTDDQLFFLSIGQSWCGARTPNNERIKLLTDVHAPLKFRVNGPLSNMPEFSEAFHCPTGSPMNPPVKNGIW